MKVFESGVLIGSTNDRTGKVVLDRSVYSCIIGKHSIWVPDLQAKIIWSHNGKIESLKDWDKGRNEKEIKFGTFGGSFAFERDSLKSIIQETMFFHEMAKAKLSPPIGETIFIRKFTSKYPYGVDYCDVMGKYGYFISDARKITEKGNFSVENFLEHFEKRIVASEGALGDLNKEQNIINGYLIDIRRTIWDMISFVGSAWEQKYFEFIPIINKSALKNKILKLTQFPHKQRKENYQTFLMDGKYESGSRDTTERWEQMNVPSDFQDKSKVVDLGCNLGAFCFEAYERGARKVVGCDYEEDYISCAQDLAHNNCYSINFIKMDLTKTGEVLNYFEKYFLGDEIDIVFALSLYKHIKGKLFELLNRLKWKTCYVESNNAPEGKETGHVKEMIKYMKHMKGVKIIDLGMTTDRSPRCIFELRKEK